MHLLMIDNYDSFTYNLVQLFFEFDIQVTVYRHDRIGLDDIRQAAPDWICISPGPKNPQHAGISQAVVRQFAGRVPILGVCLGMQVINEVFGGRTPRAPVPVHGKRWRVFHTGEGIFSGIPSPFWAARYHSLQIDRQSKELEVLAQSEDGVIMAIAHQNLPVCGVQFHPESFLSEYGLEIVANFLRLQPAFGHWPVIGTPDRFPRWAPGPGPAPCRLEAGA
jgi:anthranilate synthase component 2